MKKIKNLLIIILSFFMFPYIASADAVDFYVSSTSVTVGNCVVATVKNNDAMGLYSVTSDNGYVLSGGGNGDFKVPSGLTETYTFCGNNTGSATISFVPSNMSVYSSEQYYKTIKSITINVYAKRVIVLSDNNNLKSLGIDGTSISPEFNSDTLDYTAMLDAGTTKINITASPADDSASIDGIGEKDVVEGDNDFDITVTAENGATKTYKLKVTVKEYDPVTVKIDNKDYTVVRNQNNLTPPENYEETKIKIGNEEVPAYIGKITNYTIVSLKDSKGKQNWYVKDKDKYILYKEYKFGSTKLYVMELDKIPSGYKKTTIEYNKEKITAYKNDSKSPYALIYGMNVETGKKHTYMYEEKEGSVQIYNSKYISSNETDLYLKILIGTSIALVISLVVIVILKNKK